MIARRPSAIPIARIAGIEVRVHVSWVLIVAMIAVGLSAQEAVSHPDWPEALRWLVAGVVAALFFLSVLVHELCHGIVARRRGVDVGPVTLLFFGGTSTDGGGLSRPADEAAMAGSGPLASFALGASLVVIGRIAASMPGLGAAAVAEAAVILGVLNVLLGLINLLPVLPLDGGRIVHAVAWQATGDERRAGRLVNRLGRAIGFGMIGAGAVIAFAGDGLDGLMLAASGWFVAGSARAMEQRAILINVLRGMRVEAVMERDLPSVSPQLTLDTFAAQYLAAGRGTSLPVFRGDELLGLIGISQLRRIRRGRWPTLRASEVMVARPSLPTLGPEDELWSALERLQRAGLDGLPVMRGAELLGVLTRRGVMAAIQARTAVPGAAS